MAKTCCAPARAANIASRPELEAGGVSLNRLYVARHAVYRHGEISAQQSLSVIMPLIHSPSADIDNKIIFLNDSVDGETVSVVSFLVLTIQKEVQLRVAGKGFCRL